MLVADPLNIFLVDDDPFFLQIMQQILEGEQQTQVTVFADGVECLQQLWRQPDLIFLDHHLDTYSGYEVLHKIKRYDPNAFVVIVSGQESIQTAVDALKHGAFDYIPKNAELQQKIVQVLAKMQEVRQELLAPQPGWLTSLFKFL